MTAWIETYQTKRGKRYLVCQRVNGKVRSKSAGISKAVAIEIRNKWDAQGAKVRAGVSVESKTVEDCFREYLEVSARTKRPRTVQIIKDSLAIWANKQGDSFIGQITLPHLERFKTDLLKTNRVNGINIVIRNFKTFFGFCRKQGYIEANPADGLKQFEKEKVARFLSRQEVAKLLWNSPRNLRKALIVLLYTGMRVGEFLNYKEGDFDGQSLMVNGKTGPRQIPVHRKCRRYLGVKSTKSAMEQSFRKAVKRANLGRVRLHDFRHTFCSSYLKSGGTIADLMKITGHKSMAALQIYTHFQKGYLEERMDRMRV